jgi:DNA adenine methylase
MKYTQTKTNTRPFVKWPGNKYRFINIIVSKLPTSRTLIEPFVGSGAVFLNTNYENYVLSDANPDIINLYKTLQQHGHEFIDFCKKFFTRKNNTAANYYTIRDQFNHMQDDPITRAALFLYLNRHGYNGLCRFNKHNKFNVPFGRHHNIKLPIAPMKAFYVKAKRAKFFLRDFKDTLSLRRLHRSNAVVYCDPPYVPLSNTANFINYQAKGFDFSNQQILANLAIKLSNKGIPVLISNHLTTVTKQIYAKASELTTFQARRMISCKADSRNYVTEVLALYN